MRRVATETFALWREMDATERAIFVFGPSVAASVGPLCVWLWSIQP